MSLQVWLPLNGDLHNQGLNGAAAITTNSATVNANGKIGSCYLFDGTSNYMQFSNFNMDSLLGFSIACWIKPATDSIGGLFLVRSSSTHRIRLDDSGLTFRDTKNSNQRSIPWNHTFIADKWVHVCTVYKQGEVFIYCDGELTNHNTSYYHSDGQTNTSNTEIRIGRSQSTSGNVYFNGSINDFRIYDHTLSAKEVKEIAKGLVLHYKLDNNGLGGKNLAKNTYNLAPFSTSQVEFKAYNVGTLDVENGETVTISFDLDMIINTAANSGYLQVYNTNYPGPHQVTAQNVLSGRKLVVGEDIHERISFTTTFTTRTSGVNRTYDVLEFYSNYSTENEIHISNIKIERGTIATPWSPAPSDIGLEENIIYDSSGYNHAAAANTITWSSSSPRYSAAAHFNGTDSYIRVPFNEICPDNIFTINLWFKKDALGSKNYETLFGGPSGFEMDTRAGSSSTLTLYMASTRGGNVFSSFSFSQWYMVTMVRDGTNELYYVNGDLKKTIAAKPMPTGIYRIGAWNGDTGQNYYGEISDFRIYNNVLSADDIKELYNTSASIDNKGNIYAREVIEI